MCCYLEATPLVTLFFPWHGCLQSRDSHNNRYYPNDYKTFPCLKLHKQKLDIVMDVEKILRYGSHYDFNACTHIILLHANLLFKCLLIETLFFDETTIINNIYTI